MIKSFLVAAVSLTALTLTPSVPVLTGTAMAQQQRVPCTAQCPPTGGGGGSTYSCTSDLGYLRRVYEEDLEAVDNSDLVAIVPVCVGESYGVMRSEGNAGALRSVIADNDAMTEALFRQNFGSEDVVGVRMRGEHAVILYVHPFFQR